MIKADKLFYTPTYDGKSTSYILPEEESQHAIKVLRMQAGEMVHLVDGKGGLFEAEIINPHQKKCEVKITHSEFEYEKRDAYLHIAIAPTKMNDRMEWFLEKATEIGINEITPIICDHSERKEIKLARMEKRLISAMKQSAKAYLPKLNQSCTLKQFLNIQRDNSQKFIAHCYNNEKQDLKEVYSPKSNALILIGPEGDFSSNEVEMAIKNGFSPISLGNSRLRTETAGIVACHTFNLLNSY